MGAAASVVVEESGKPLDASDVAPEAAVAEVRRLRGLLAANSGPMVGDVSSSKGDDNPLLLTVATFEVDAPRDEVVARLSPSSPEDVRAGWLALVPGFEPDCEVVMVDEGSGFRATNAGGAWMWVTDIASSLGEAEAAVYTCRVYVSDAEDGAPARPTKYIFTVVQTWTVTPRAGGGAVIERKFTSFDGGDGIKRFLLGGMIDKENANVVAQFQANTGEVAAQ
jgi:hypothetical protein